MPRLEIEIGGSDKGGAAQLQKTLGLLEELVALKKDLTVDLFKAETADEIKLVGEMLTATNVSIGKYMDLASKATNVWKEDKTQTILGNLNTKLTQVASNVKLLGDAKAMARTQINAYQKAIDDMIKIGIDPASDKIGELQDKIRGLQAQMMNSEGAKNINAQFQKTGALITDAQTKIRQLEHYLSLARSEASIGKLNRRLQDARKELERLRKAGLDAGVAMNSLSGGTNAAATEFSRIVQDAPYASQNLGSIGNNITRLGELVPQYVANLRSMAVAQGIAATNANLLRLALVNMVTGWNGVVLAISLAVTAFTFWQQWTQKQAREQEKLRNVTKTLREEIDKQVESLNALNQAKAQGLGQGRGEITQLNALRQAIEDSNAPMDMRIKAIKQLKKEYPEYFKAQSNDALLAGTLGSTYDKLANSLLKTALAQANLKKAMELGEVGANIDTIVENNIENISRLAKAMVPLQKEQKKLLDMGATEGVGGARSLDSMSPEEANLAARLRIVNQQLKPIQEEYNKLVKENVKLSADRYGIIQDTERLSRKINDYNASGADPTNNVGNGISEATEKVKRSAKELTDEIDKLFTAEIDPGNLIGLEGFDENIRKIDNKYNNLILKLQSTEADWLKTYQEEKRRKFLSDKEYTDLVENLEQKSLAKRLEIEKAHMQEVVKTTEEYEKDRIEKIIDLQNRATTEKIKSREQELRDNQVLWEKLERDNQKYNISSVQWAEWRRQAESEINAKWNEKDFDTLMTFQTRSNQKFADILLKRLNAETKMKIDAAKGDTAKLLDIQKEYEKSVAAIRSADMDRQVQGAFKGGAMDVPLAKMDATMTLLRENFDKGTISVGRFREEVLKINSAKEVLTSFNSLLESSYNAMGTFVVDTLSGAEDRFETLEKAMESAAKNIVGSLIKIGLQYLVNMALGKTTMASTTVASVAAAKTVSTAWASAAALVSAATFGANVATGGAALAGLMLSTKALAGFSKGGYTGNVGRNRIAGVVHGQEFVVNADATRENIHALTAMNAGKDASKFLPSAPKSTNFGSTRSGKVETIQVAVTGDISNNTIKVSNDRGNRFNQKFGRG